MDKHVFEFGSIGRKTLGADKIEWPHVIDEITGTIIPQIRAVEEMLFAGFIDPEDLCTEKGRRVIGEAAYGCMKGIRSQVANLLSTKALMDEQLKATKA